MNQKAVNRLALKTLRKELDAITGLANHLIELCDYWQEQNVSVGIMDRYLGVEANLRDIVNQFGKPQPLLDKELEEPV